MDTAIDELINKAISQAKSGNKDEAKQLLSQAVRQEPGNVRAWYLLSQVVDNNEHAEFCLNKVLSIQPDNVQARQKLEQLRTPATSDKEIIKETPKVKPSGSKSGRAFITIGVVGLLIVGVLLIAYFVLTGSGNEITPQDVIDAFKAAGLEVENPRPMTADDYGFAPLGDEGIRFMIPSICPDCGGRVIKYSDKTYLEKAKTYYDTLGKESAVLFSWTFVHKDVLVQINGELPEEKALKYKSALDGLGK